MKYKVIAPDYESTIMQKEQADGYIAYLQKFWSSRGPYTIQEICEDQDYKSLIDSCFKGEINNYNKDDDYNYFKYTKFIDKYNADLYSYPKKLNKIEVPSWDEFFMRQVYLYASKSKDKSSKLGAILVKDKIILSGGYNGICRGLDDNIKERNERPTKYFYYEHSERNCLYNAARNGISTLGAVIFTNGIPCVDCSRAVIQCGCINIYTHKQWNDIQRQNKSKWAEHFAISEEMFNESRINLVELDLLLGIDCLLDGKIIKV